MKTFKITKKDVDDRISNENFFFIFGNFSKKYQTHINRTNLFTSQGFFCSIWGSALKTYRFKISMKIIYQSRTITRVNEKLSFAPPMFNRERGRRRGGAAAKKNPREWLLPHFSAPHSFSLSSFSWPICEIFVHQMIRIDL